MATITTRKVFVYYTGGTIGSAFNADGELQPVDLDVMSDFIIRHTTLYEKKMSETEKEAQERVTIGDGWFQLHQKAVDDYSKNYQVLYKIEKIAVPIDSSKMTPEQWFEIASRIKEVQKDYDGFVIIHGTDTMAYTSSALSFILRDLKKPVILIGAQRSMFHPRSNADDNFIGAMLMAGCYSDRPILQQVMIYDDNKLFKGNRVCKFDCDSFQIFDSPNAEPLARLEAIIKVRDCQPSSKGKIIAADESTSEKFPDVRMVKFFPGIQEDYVRCVLEGADGVIFETFGSGNAPELPWLYKHLMAANERGVMMLNCTQVYKGTVLPVYEASHVLRKAGVMSGYDITPEAALTKMIWTLKMIANKEIQRKVLEASIAGETSAPPVTVVIK